MVVSERSQEALSDAVHHLLEGGKDILEMRRAALSAAQLFAIDRVAHLFQSEVAAVAELKWAERVRSETPNT